MTTVKDVIEEARGHLMGSQRDRFNRLNGAIDNAVVAIPLEFDVQHNNGAVISIELEDMYVYAAASGIGSDTVERGFAGSAAVSHPDNSLVLVNPIFSNWRIFRGINNTLLDLSSRGLFQIKQAADFNYNPSVYSYSLPADTKFVQSIRIDTPSSTNEWPLVPRQDFQFEPNADTDEFATGKMLVLYRGYSGRNVRVTYRSGFTLLPNTSWTTDLTATGLHPEAYDLLALGAAIDLAAGREIQRTFLEKQPEPRRGEEVPVTGSLQAYRGLLAKYEARIETELSRLNEYYPLYIW